MAEKLKIGILDLLTILLPGAFLLILICFYYTSINSFFSDKKIFFDLEWINTAMFIGSAYILGHFIFFIASFLDDLIYDKVKRVYWRHHNKLTAYVLQLKQQRTGVNDSNVLNAFKWSNAYLMSKEPAIYGEVERHMAESKFFRSFCIVLIIVFLFFIFSHEKHVNGTSIFIVIVLAFLSLIRYLTQRQKSIETAYHGIITTCTEPLKLPDELLTSLEKKNIYPYKKLYDKIYIQDKKSKITAGTAIKLWFYNLLYSLIKFLYTAALCLIPFFEYYKTKNKP